MGEFRTLRLNDFKNNNKGTNTTSAKNKFVNYKQRPLDNDLLRKIEQHDLKNGINLDDNDDEVIKKLGVKL